MKLCPQCAFIYEDNQRFCDMDGKELVNDPAPVVIQQSVSPPTRLTISLLARSEKSLPARAQQRRFPVLIPVGAILAMLLAGLCLALLQGSRSSDAVHSPIQPPARSTAPDGSPQRSPADLVSSTSSAVTPLPEQSPEQSFEQSPEESLSTNVTALNSAASVSQLSQSPSSTVSAGRARFASTPVSAGGLTGKSRGPVLVRLTNGATIKADEAWERREGIWYRQAGMVTFLKRSRVRTIERLTPLQPLPRSVANNSKESSRKSEIITAQNQLGIGRLGAADTKKQSRVRSFLKKTGRILKKPFKF